MTKDERIALLNADIAAGRIAVQVRGPLSWKGAAPIRIINNGGGRIRVSVDGPEGLTVISDEMQPLTSFRLESGGRSILCMMDGSGSARVDGGDPGDEDWP